VTKAIASRYRRAGKVAKGVILDELCATTGWHRNHARKALAAALRPRIVKARKARAPRYGEDVVAALVFCWAVLGAPSGKRLAPIMGELAPRLRRFEELMIADETAALLMAMSPATIDRRLAPDRARMALRGRSRTKPGSLLKSQIPIRTWAQWDDAVPGFVEIDLVGHEGGNAVGDHCYTLTVTDIATGWTENRSVKNKARRWVIAALEEISLIMPFPIIGVDSDNGSEFINHHLLDWCAQRQITFTRSRPGNSNDGAHVEQKNWAVVRTVVGYHRYDTAAELALLNRIWVPQSLMTNYFHPQQKLISKVRNGAKVTRKYDPATTPHRRAEQHPAVAAEDRIILAGSYAELNPAGIQREIQALTDRLLRITTSKAAPTAKPSPQATAPRASANESTTPATRAS
jgi:transposase InsO family protein